MCVCGVGGGGGRAYGGLGATWDLTTQYLDRMTLLLTWPAPHHIQGPEAFFEAERQVRDELEKQHYHSFFASDLYHQYISTQEHDEEEMEDLDNLSIVSS